jgi:hypothetical protein
MVADRMQIDYERWVYASNTQVTYAIAEGGFFRFTISLQRARLAMEKMWTFCNAWLLGYGNFLSRTRKTGNCQRRFGVLPSF